jgi:hypothetical protein
MSTRWVLVDAPNHSTPTVGHTYQIICIGLAISAMHHPTDIVHADPAIHSPMPASPDSHLDRQHT